MGPRLALRAAAACCLLLLAAQGAAQDGGGAAGEVLTFGRAVELAAQSSSVRAAEAQRDLAKLALDAATSPVSASATGGATASTDFGDQGTNVAIDLSVNASLRLGWGSSGEAVAAARRSLEAAEDAVEGARSDAVQQAVRLYSTALSAAGARDAAELQLQVASLQAEATRARFAAGAALEADVTQADLTLKSAELDLSAAEADLAAAYTDLSLALGVSVAGVAAEVPAGDATEVEGSLRGALTDERLAARADVRAAQRDVAAAAEALAQARRAAGVNVSANASVSTTSGPTSVSLGASIDARDLTPSLTGRLSTSTGQSAGGDPSWRASLGVSATVPLGPADTRVPSAELSYEQALSRLAQTQASAAVEVGALRAQVEADAARVEVARSRAALAATASDTAQARFDLGLINRADLLQARVAKLQADGQVLTAQLDHLVDLMALARALGYGATEVLR